jgi:hypothetical protein
VREPRTPETDRERAYHDQLWLARQEVARLRRQLAVARVRLERGEIDGALLELELASA